LELIDILPEDNSSYDKMRPPKLNGQPAKVFNHFTIMGLDSINENSMVIISQLHATIIELMLS